VKVEIWSDVVCPWCSIGKRRFEIAVERFEHGDQIEVVWRSFELDPSAPRRHEGDLVDRLAQKYGMSAQQAKDSQAHLTAVAAEEGLDFRFDQAQSGNSFDAHRLLHLAGEHGLQGALKDRLFRAYFTEGEAIGEPETLRRLALEVGLAPNEVDRVLRGDAFTDAVRADEAEAVALGVSGVPFFVVDRRFGVSGAQSSDLLLEVLQQAWVDQRQTNMVANPDADTAVECDADGCAVPVF
jgi:predicted DsbA family dithiol-disulfide isomerase